MYKNLESRIKFYWKTIEHTLNVIFDHTLNVILAHTLNVILGFIPRIHANQNLVRHYRACPDNLDPRVEPEDDNRMRSFFKPEDDGEQSLIKGFDVVRQYAALLERRVQSSTRVRKFLADGVQCGRSMIEMLGVLAIVGVLSVGGIAGYSKAMTKFKINKAIDEVNTIVSNTKIIFANSKTITAPSGDSYFYPEREEEDFEFMRNFIMPKETDTGVKNEYGENMFQSPFGGEIYAALREDGIIIYLSDLPREACIALGSYDWKDAENVSVSKNDSIGGGGAFISSLECASIKRGIDQGPSYDEEGLVGRCKYYNDILPMSPDLAAKGCSCTSNTCQFSVMFP